MQINQETIALTLVGFAAVSVSWRMFLKNFARSLSLKLIQKGHTKAGFWMKKKTDKKSCDDCSNCD